jgi:undecaprenyl-diphosphatase
VSAHLTYPEAIVIGLLQGVTELFPVSSLGHSILLPAVLGGRWARDLDVSAPESPYLAFVVGLHVATALALLIFFWRDWVRVLTGLVSSIRRRRVETSDERLGWMIVLATIPVGLTGLLLEHTFRTVLGRPVPAAIFLMINGVLLYAAERLRRRAAQRSRVPAAVVAGDGIYRSRAPRRRATAPRTGGSPHRPSPARWRSGRPRSWRCCPVSAARARRWPPAC